ncbi:hypothetical protein TUZN_0113 [Thermoproteus uzoniensis 768-20]|uniref:ATPase AAA-type core domain-containing protein n=1 Tax=Thermoproteus uzoniensis (strain 768-20) TaxID=999630 RepID=F2L1E6_THEU7|nr:hypothetical protein [Thermoproteus uzoniensis]AEA11616.1 hypothetical protein TUZN_0113 [Thermoproteus uzoniensis 768-20]
MEVYVRNLGPLSEAAVKLSPITLFIGVNRSGKSILANAISAVTTAFAEAQREYARLYAEERLGRYAKPKSLAQLFNEKFQGEVFSIPVRRGEREAVISIKYGDASLVVTIDNVANFSVKGDMFEKAEKTTRDTLRVSARGDFDYTPYLYSWRTLGRCQRIYPEALRWITKTFDIVLMGDAVYEGGNAYRHVSSMVESLVDLGRRGGCQNLVLEEPEAHLHDDAVFELAKFIYGQASGGRGFLVTTHSDLLAAWVAALASHPDPGELGVELAGGRPEVRMYRFRLRAVGDAYVEEVDLSGGEVDMDELQLKVMEELSKALARIRDALRAA